MARMARIKLTDRPAWYHVYARAAEYRGLYPLERRGARGKLLSLIRQYSEAYFCGVSAYSLMGNHSHFVTRFEEPREVERSELYRRALLLYPQREQWLEKWQDEAWEHLRHRLFNISEMMRNIQGKFGSWFNECFDRRGHFWGQRFGSTLLADGDAVLDSMLYVELNPVRAHLAEVPEEWEFGSSYCRALGQDGWLMPLDEVFPWMDPEKVERDYRARLYYRGAVATKEGEGVIPAEVVEDEVRRGFDTRGVYLKRMRHFTRGLVLGSREVVAEWLASLQQEGRSPRRKKPVAQPGSVFSLRSQRARASPR